MGTQRKSKKMSDLSKGFMQGAAWALGVLASGFGHDNLAAMVANEGNFTSKDFDDAEADAADVDHFRAELDMITNRAENRRTKAA